MSGRHRTAQAYRYAQQGRGAVGVFDQIIASLASLAITSFAARRLSTTEFGTFALLYAALTFTVGAGRAYLCEAGLALYQRFSPTDRRAIVAAPVQRWLAVGAVASAGFAAGPLGAPRPHVVDLVTVTLVAIAGCGAIDSIRMSYLARGEPWKATWLSLCLLALNLVAVSRADKTVLGIMTAVATSTWLISVPYVLLFSRSVFRHGWIRQGANLVTHGRRYAIEFLFGNGTYLAATYVASSIAGLQAAAALRGAEVVYGPIRVVVSILPSAFVAAAGGKAISRRACALIALVMSVCAALYVAAFSFAPERILRQVLGNSTKIVQAVLPYGGIGVVALTISCGAIVGMRSRVASRSSVRTRALTSPALIVGSACGALLGAKGASAGISFASVLAAFIWWRSFYVADRAFLRRERAEQTSHDRTRV